MSPARYARAATPTRDGSRHAVGTPPPLAECIFDRDKTAINTIYRAGRLAADAHCSMQARLYGSTAGHANRSILYMLMGAECALEEYFAA